MRLSVFGSETLGFAIQLLRSRLVRDEHHAITKRRGLTFLQREVECGLFGIEDAAAQWIRRKQTIPARMPISWIAWILWMIENGNRHRVIAGAPIVCMSGQRT